MDRLRAQNADMAAMPPVDELIAAYFMAKEWWTPASDPSAPVADEVWKQEMPEFEE
jgi:hypothetical protein